MRQVCNRQISPIAVKFDHHLKKIRDNLQQFAAKCVVTMNVEITAGEMPDSKEGTLYKQMDAVWQRSFVGLCFYLSDKAISEQLQPGC